MMELDVMSRRTSAPEAVRLEEITVHEDPAQVPPGFVAEILGRTAPKVGARLELLHVEKQKHGDQRVVDGDALWRSGSLP